MLLAITVDLAQFKELEEYCKTQYADAASIIHRFEHISRTANGAAWFVRLRGGTKRQQELAYVAGLLHDIVRPNTESIDHAIASASKAEIILKKFKFPQEEIPLVVEAVRDHRKVPKEWHSILHESVFLADKILEQMGTYVVFRRCMYAGEIEDYKEIGHKEAIEHRFTSAGKKTERPFFPEWALGLYDYQRKFETDFLQAFIKNEKWAQNLGEKIFLKGREKRLSLDEAIKAYSPVSQKDKEYLEETLDYIAGKKLAEYEKLLND